MILTSIIIVNNFSIIIENHYFSWLFLSMYHSFVYSLFTLLSGTPINEFLSLSSIPVLSVENDHDVTILRISHPQAKRMRIMELARSLSSCCEKRAPPTLVSVSSIISHDQLSQHCTVRILHPLSSIIQKWRSQLNQRDLNSPHFRSSCPRFGWNCELKGN